MLGFFNIAIGTIVSAAVSVVKTISSIGLGIEGLGVIVNSIINVCKTLAVVKEDTSIEALGNKIMQAEECGLVPENFKSYDEYVKMLENFECNSEKNKQYTIDQKLKKAAEFGIGILFEKFPNLTPDTFEKLVKIPNLSPEKIAASIDILNTGKPDDINNIVGVLTNSLKDTEKYLNGLKYLVTIEKTINPDIDVKQAEYNAINTIKNANNIS